jgi:gluconolactonase
MDVEFTQVTSGLIVAEGPLALDDGSVLLVEVLAGRITSVSADGEQRVIAEPGGGPNGLALGPDGRVFVCNNGGLTDEDVAWISSPEPETYERPARPFEGRIEVLDPNSGSIDVLYDAVDGEHLTAPNDLVFDAHGGFWFTDFGSLFHRGPQTGFLYYATADGEHVERAAGPLYRPNGVGLSPDGTEVYVSETFSGRVWAWDVTAPGRLRTGPGEASGARLVCEVVDAGWDSLAVEEDGTLCVAATIGGYIGRITPGDGAVDRVPIDVGEHPTNICFGGPDRRTAYVTMRGGGFLLRAEWPVPGLKLNYYDDR